MVACSLRSFLFVAFVLGLAPPQPARAQAQALLENPQPNSFLSGLGVISGWVCDAARIDIELDGVRFQAAYGTSRADTRPDCRTVLRDRPYVQDHECACVRFDARTADSD